MQIQPASITWTVTSTAAFFIIDEVTRNILIYELDVLYVFDINIDEISRFI